MRVGAMLLHEPSELHQGLLSKRGKLTTDQVAYRDGMGIGQTDHITT